MNIILRYLYPFCLCLFFLLIFNDIFSQSQICPANFNFGMGSLTDWFAYTGNNQAGNGPGAIKDTFKTTSTPPTGTIGATSIPEYNISTPGIQVNTLPATDPFGFFTTIPNINGYQYTNSAKLGSSSVSPGGGSGGPSGGYIRGIKYLINVPTSNIVQPYTITYAYAMVLENGSHPTQNQPLFTATLKAIGFRDSVIQCASPKYNLPTLGNGNGNGTGATLDTAAARIQGFTLSSTPSPNQGNPNESKLRVYTKSWVEVTLDLSPFRGQQVSLTFESDNCVPGGHFCYAYIALRNVCAGLQITGDTAICSTTPKTYSVPELAGATYDWIVPNGWTYTPSPNNPNIIIVQPNAVGGKIIAHEKNDCADLYDTIQVNVYAPPLPGSLSGNAEVCTGINSKILTLAGNTGNIVSWVSSTNNGISWNSIANTAATYTATNLTATTLFKALVQGNPACPVDSSNAAIITVDSKSIAGKLNPPNTNICANQNINSLISLTGNNGKVVNWQTSTDNGATWNNFAPIKTDTTYYVNASNVGGAWQFRVVDQNGVCPADTSSIAAVTFFPTVFPSGAAYPADTSICYGTAAQLNADISIGTSYKWSSSQLFSGKISDTILNTPLTVFITANPTANANYYITIKNSGCPNALIDTFLVKVFPKIKLFAGNDTNIVIGQPLLFQSVTDSTVTIFNWVPPTGLNNTNILRPTSIITNEMLNGNYYITYTITASNAIGCNATSSFTVRVFKTPPSIFVPNAFTPNGDGKNDVLRPILAGIARLNYFRVYNRLGQMVYSTQTPGQGWDGNFKGNLQDVGAYVYMVQAIDYTKKTINQKGSFVLIR